MMKINYLKIDKPCSEDFSKMNPSESGRFCQLCEKNVVDFTQLSALEIAQIMQNSNGKICARMKESQLQSPIIEYNVQRKAKNSFSNITAGLLVATTLAGQPAMAENNAVNTVFSTSLKGTSETDNSLAQKAEKLLSSDSITFRGRVVLDETGQPLENVEVSIVTLSKSYKCLTTEQGTFSLEIPKSALKEKNIVSITFNELKRKDLITKIESKNYVLAKWQLKNRELRVEQIPTKNSVNTGENRIILGMPNRNPVKLNSMIVIDGNIEKVETLQNLPPELVEDVTIYKDEIAVILGGEKARDGLIMITTIHGMK